MRRKSLPLHLIPLEDRTVPAALSAVLDQGILQITGSEDSDRAILRFVNGAYSVDGIAAAFPATGVTSIQVSGLGGNDTIDMRTARVPVTVSGGNGNDTIVGGAFSDILNGDAGNDTIWGGSGNDVIDGSAGDDRLYGEAGDDTINGGGGTDTIDGGTGFNTINTSPAPTPTPTPPPATPLNVTPSANDYYSRTFADPTLQILCRTFAADNWFSRSEMLSIYSQVGKDGTVSANELADMVRIVTPNWSGVPLAQQYGMEDSVRVLATMVAQGDRANGSYQGSALGNLLAGSNSAQLQKLVNKWFLGQDRPQASGTYRAVSGSLFQNGPAHTDIDQGGLGDCYYLAALANIAKSRPDAIRQMFTDNGDGTFTVRFFRDGAARYVTVDRFLPVSSTGRAVYADFGGRFDATSNELWVGLAEKAYAQINESGWINQDGTNTYTGISGGWSDDVFRQVMSGSAGWRWMSQTSQSATASLVTSNTPIVLGSKTSGTTDNIASNHAYSLIGYSASTGKFTLYNPWGSSLELTWSQITANFNGYWFAG